MVPLPSSDGEETRASPHPAARRFQDQPEHSVQIGPHLLGGDAQHGNALFGQPVGAARVRPGAVRVFVAKAVHLDRQRRRRTVEVEDEGPDRMLAPDPQAAQSTATQLGPQPGLGRGQTPPQGAGLSTVARSTISPPPSSMVPLPITTGRRRKAPILSAHLPAVLGCRTSFPLPGPIQTIQTIQTVFSTV